MGSPTDAESEDHVADATIRRPVAARTLVIVLAEITVIVALIVLWSVLRGRGLERCEGPSS